MVRAPEFKHLYLDEKSADVYFLCGPEFERVPAHKSILCEASDVFKCMFYGPIAEKGDKRLPESVEVLQEFLKFCYFN